MNTKMAVGLLLTLVATLGIAVPTSASPEVHIVADGPSDCLVINETGEVDADIPACRRFINNITNT